MNTHTTPSHTNANTSPFSCEGLEDRLKNDPQSLFFPGSPCGAAYSRCPAPSTPNVTLVADAGVSCLLDVKVEGKHYLILRSNEAVTMPVAYATNLIKNEFSCIYEKNGHLFYAALFHGLPGFLEAVIEDVGTPFSRLSPLGLDLLMRVAVFSDVPSIKLNPKDRTADGAASSFTMQGVPPSVNVVRRKTSKGDTWMISSPAGCRHMTTFDAKRGN